MTVPDYLATFRRAVRRLEENEKSPTLISHNSLISRPSPSQAVTEGKVSLLRPTNTTKARTREKSEISEKRIGAFPYAEALDQLECRCPEYVEPERWQQCIRDACRFLAAWGEKALALSWTADELFGLHQPPAKPHPSYCRLSRYDCTGLLWLLQGSRVIALTNTTAAIEKPSGAIVTYRKLNKPALGPLGDSLDDFTGGGPEAA